MKLQANETAVLVVDMQKCFAQEDGSLYSEASEAVIPDIAAFIEDAKNAGALLGYTRDTHPEDQFDELDNYDEFGRWGEHAVPGTEEHEIVDGLDVEADIGPIDKNTYDAFYETDLAETLEENGIQNVIVIGTLANVCVLHTASSAALNDFRTVVLEDLVGYIQEDDKEYALDHVEWLFGEVEDSDDVEFI